MDSHLSNAEGQVKRNRAYSVVTHARSASAQLPLAGPSGILSKKERRRGRERKGKEGKGRERKGKEGKGRERKGKEGRGELSVTNGERMDGILWLKFFDIEKATSELIDIDPKIVAEHMTIIDHELLKAIPMSELLQKNCILYM